MNNSEVNNFTGHSRLSLSKKSNFCVDESDKWMKPQQQQCPRVSIFAHFQST